ncbi:DUF3052 domain-containing protein [Corynebacterium sp. 13CS0277]|uniref:DUF3052 domain-containing protein n=1 Tax=Corynebacterium sp. 13CS0277 TaxID=2071994 RepID=UPI000D032F2A|nr:DUF3052 domain-containing protein [Corynebacterium sp. 13CS0277]PRQ10713.1 DUF3052 domain-containing protein [Corynebacterium sp. 13CS0277]
MTGTHDYVRLLGISSDDVVQEVGWDDDCDSAISEAIEDAIGEELLDEDTDEMVDVVLLWWRKDDGDPVDGMVDSLRSLSDGGRVWLLTPGAGKAGAIDPGVIQESAQTAGMVQTSAERLGDWQGSCLVKGGGR